MAAPTQIWSLTRLSWRKTVLTLKSMPTVETKACVENKQSKHRSQEETFKQEKTFFTHRSEGIVGVAEQEGSFAHAAVADDQQFEHVVEILVGGILLPPVVLTHRHVGGGGVGLRRDLFTFHCTSAKRATTKGSAVRQRRERRCQQEVVVVSLEEESVSVTCPPIDIETGNAKRAAESIREREACHQRA